MILFYDTETTGLPDWHSPSDGEQQPHIVQLAALLVDPDSRLTVNSIDLVVRPDGWTIPEEVTAIHGITTEYAAEVGVSERLAVQILLDMWDGRRLRVGHSEGFDARIIRIALKRYFGDDMADRWKEAKAACTGRLARPIMRLPPKGRYGYKMPKLAEAYARFVGGEIDGAHSAVADAMAARDVYFAIQDYQSVGPDMPF